MHAKNCTNSELLSLHMYSFHFRTAKDIPCMRVQIARSYHTSDPIYESYKSYMKLASIFKRFCSVHLTFHVRLSSFWCYRLHVFLKSRLIHLDEPWTLSKAYDNESHHKVEKDLKMHIHCSKVSCGLIVCLSKHNKSQHSKLLTTKERSNIHSCSLILGSITY